MNMSQDLFERIVGAQTVDKQTKSAVLPVGCRRAPDRRATARVPFGKRTQIRRDGGNSAGKWTTVVVQDVSLGGLGFLCEDSVPVGDTFIVRLPQRDGRLARIRCAARRCEQGGFGGTAFLVGATFEQVIEEPSIRLNEDDGQPAVWDDGAEAAAAKSGRIKQEGRGLVRAAVRILRAVDPIRHAAHWIRRQDDFSSN